MDLSVLHLSPFNQVGTPISMLISISYHAIYDYRILRNCMSLVKNMVSSTSIASKVPNWTKMSSMVTGPSLVYQMKREERVCLERQHLAVACSSCLLLGCHAIKQARPWPSGSCHLLGRAKNILKRKILLMYYS